MNEELAKLGRIHTFEEFVVSWELAREAGFENINVDLMSGASGSGCGLLGNVSSGDRRPGAGAYPRPTA